MLLEKIKLAIRSSAVAMQLELMEQRAISTYYFVRLVLICNCFLRRKLPRIDPKDVSARHEPSPSAILVGHFPLTIHWITRDRKSVV